MSFPLSLHVVFGQVISGQDIVRSIENQKTDPNNRPVCEVKMVNCGELVPKPKGMCLDFHTPPSYIFLVFQRLKQHFW